MSAVVSRYSSMPDILLLIAVLFLLFVLLLVIGWILMRHHRAGKAADEQVRKLSQAVEASPAMTAILDSRGIIEYVNPRYLQVSGYTAAELIGRDAFAMCIQSEEEAEAMWRTLRSGQEWRGTILSKRKSGPNSKNQR